MASHGLRGKAEVYFFPQTQPATRLGISQNMVSDIESGKGKSALQQ